MYARIRARQQALVHASEVKHGVGDVISDEESSGGQFLNRNQSVNTKASSSK